MKRYLHYFVGGMVFCSVVMLIGCNGFKGLVLEKVSGRKIPGARITFFSEDGTTTRGVTTDNRGSYRISLEEGRYWATATHRDYEDYSSFPGLFVVISGGGYQTANIALEEPRVTTVLLVRHAEKVYPPYEPDEETPLSPAGEARARKLADVARKAGVTAIYATRFMRTQQTAQPLANFLRIQPIIEDDMNQLVNKILSDHRGDVVLVAGHSPTVPQIARLLGATIPQQLHSVEDFDNLFVVTRKSDGGEANAINLQYGESSLPDIWRGHNTTIKIRSGTSDGSVLAATTTLVPGPLYPGAQPIASFRFSGPTEGSPNEAYFIEWIPPGDKLLTWMAAEGNPYLRGTAFGCTGIAIPDEDFIFTTYKRLTPLGADQVNDVQTGKSRGCGTPSTGDLSQSLTPSASPLVAVDLRLRAGGEFPDGSSYPMTTILLVRHAESGEAGKKRAETLAHGAFKADVTAIYASPTKETVQRLADVRGLKVNSYNADDVQGFVNQLLSEHDSEVVVVAGENETLSEIIKKLGGSPLPPIYKDEYDNLFVITVHRPGEAKVVSLQYGEPSP